MPLIPTGKRCSACKRLKPLTAFNRLSLKQQRIDKPIKLYPQCKSCHYKANAICQIARLKKNPRLRLWQSSYANARNRGIEHTIKVEDIPRPVLCKYLGIRIDYRCASERGRLRSYNAPSIDRIDSTRGYVPGNIQVISDLANRMKSNATVEQLLAFAQGVLRVHG